MASEIFTALARGAGPCPYASHTEGTRMGRDHTRPFCVGQEIGLALPGFVPSRMEARRPDSPGPGHTRGFPPAQDSDDGDIDYLGSE